MKTIPVKGSNIPALVDDEDYPVLSRMNWRLSTTTGYVLTTINNVQIQMNRMVIGQRANKNLLVVYRNDNFFDNRKENLEIWRRSEYAKATRRGHTCTSKYLGVFYHKAMHKWCTKPYANGKMLGIKYFDNEADAAEAYIKIMARHGKHYSLESLLLQKRHVEDYGPILIQRETKGSS